VGRKKKDFRDWFEKRKITHEVLDKNARREGLPWRIQAAAVVERLPTLLPEPEEWESDYLELKEYFDSFDYDYPEQIINRDKFYEFGKKHVDDDDYYDDYDDDEEEDNDEIIEKIEETNDDENIMNLDRKQDSRLYFVSRKEEKKIWEFPTVELQDGETLLNGAERIAASVLGKDTSLFSISNCPVGVTLQTSNDKEKFFGTKTFFMKLQLQYQNGTVVSPEMKDNHSYGWLDRSELSEDYEEKNKSYASKLYFNML